MESITFKATNQKYELHLHAEASFHQIVEEVKQLIERLDASSNYGIKEPLTVYTGNRLLTSDQKKQIKKLIDDHSIWTLTQIISSVLSLEEAMEIQNRINIQVEYRNISGGEILEVDGDVLIVGNIEAGGFVRATGNIFIMGELDGICDAGYSGNKDAVVAGLFKDYSNVRIAKETENVFTGQPSQTMKVYYLNNQEQITCVSVKDLHEIRPNINFVKNFYQNAMIKGYT